MHVLEVDLQKKGELLLIAAAMELLPHGSGNFGHDSSLKKSDVNWGKPTIFIATKFQRNFCTPALM